RRGRNAASRLERGTPPPCPALLRRGDRRLRPRDLRTAPRLPRGRGASASRRRGLAVRGRSLRGGGAGLRPNRGCCRAEVRQLAGVRREVAPAHHARAVDGERAGLLPARSLRVPVADALTREPRHLAERAPPEEVRERRAA